MLHGTSLLPSSLLPLLLWIVLVSSASISVSPILAASAATSATSLHGVLHLADTLCKNPYFSNSRSIVRVLVLCFHAHPIVFIGLVAVNIRNMMFLWECAVLTILVYIVSTGVAVEEVRKVFERVG